MNLFLDLFKGVLDHQEDVLERFILVLPYLLLCGLVGYLARRGFGRSLVCLVRFVCCIQSIDSSGVSASSRVSNSSGRRRFFAGDGTKETGGTVGERCDVSFLRGHRKSSDRGGNRVELRGTMEPYLQAVQSAR